MTCAPSNTKGFKHELEIHGRGSKEDLKLS